MLIDVGCEDMLYDFFFMECFKLVGFGVWGFAGRGKGRFVMNIGDFDDANV